METNQFVDKNTALLIVDYQNDFCNNGTLVIQDSLQLCDYLNELIMFFFQKNNLIIASKDFHPETHISFLENGGIWPKHCVQNSYGSEFPNNLLKSKIRYVIRKGINENSESYSSFEDENGYPTKLNELLKENNIKKLYVVGLALDFCVIETIKDALKNNYQIVLDLKGTRAYDTNNTKKIIQKYKKLINIINNNYE